MSATRKRKSTKGRPTPRAVLEWRIALLASFLAGVESRPSSPSKASEMSIIRNVRACIEGEWDSQRKVKP